MARLPDPVARFLAGKRFAVAGVSRDPRHAANAIFRKLRAGGYEVVPVNPQSAEVEGVVCHADLASVPGALDGVVISTPPAAAREVVRQAAQRGVPRVWLHRSFGTGSVSADAVRECEAHGIECIVGGCPLMYCEPVDVAHRCFRFLLGLRGRVPR